MTVVSAERASRPQELGTWTTVAQPAAGSPWAKTVPSNETWRLLGGGCMMKADATVGTRVAGIEVTSGGALIYVRYNIDTQGTGAGHAANESRHIFYHRFLGELPRSWTSAPYPVGLPDFWLPPGSVITGVVSNLQAGDQMYNVRLLVEERSV
jgi:hypothetical protein